MKLKLQQAIIHSHYGFFLSFNAPHTFPLFYVTIKKWSIFPFKITFTHASLLSHSPMLIVIKPIISITMWGEFSHQSCYMYSMIGIETIKMDNHTKNIQKGCLGLIDINNLFPFDPLFLWKLSPHEFFQVHLQLTIHFILILSIYNVYILHHLDNDHTSYLHYISLN